MMVGWEERRIRGFTLVELMVAVVVVGILTSIAVPTYDAFMDRSRRVNAEAVMVELSLWMERFYTVNNSYDETEADDTPVEDYLSANAGYLECSPKPREGESCADTSDKIYYDIALSDLSVNGYTIIATPRDGTGQADDKCGTLILTSTGRKSIADAKEGVTVDQCW